MNPYQEAVNLYDYEGPAIKRRSVLDQIVTSLRNNLTAILVGSRFSGKTGILMDAKKDTDVWQSLGVESACFVDLAREKTLKDASCLVSLLRERLEASGEPLSDSASGQWSVSHPTLLLLDNVHVLHGEVLGNGLQELEQHCGDQIRVLCSMRKHKSRQFTDLLASMPQVEIGPLDVDDVKVLMDEGGDDMRVGSSQEKSDVASTIIEVSGGKPLFVNLICYFLVEMSERNDSPESLPQNRDAMIARLESHRNESLLSAIGHYLWNTLTERYERLVLLEIATKGPLKDGQLRNQLGRYLDRTGSGLSQLWLSEALRRAQNEGLITLGESGEYASAISLITYWFNATKEPAAELDLEEWRNEKQIVLCW